MDVREKLVELIRKAKLSMWGKNGLSNEKAQNSYIADYLISNGVTVQEWIPVTDRFPETDGYFLCWNDFHGCIVGHFWAKGKYFISKAASVTHWMPLPEPPKEDDNAKMQ